MKHIRCLIESQNNSMGLIEEVISQPSQSQRRKCIQCSFVSTSSVSRSRIYSNAGNNFHFSKRQHLVQKQQVRGFFYTSLSCLKTGAFIHLWLVSIKLSSSYLSFSVDRGRTELLHKDSDSVVVLSRANLSDFQLADMFL